MKKETAREIVRILSENFSDKPALEYKTPYELLIAVMLSAQCTDARVNLVTRELFKQYNTPETMLTLSQEELEKATDCDFQYPTDGKILIPHTAVWLQKTM